MTELEFALWAALLLLALLLSRRIVELLAPEYGVPMESSISICAAAGYNENKSDKLDEI
jgi:hypothetical protein